MKEEGMISNKVSILLAGYSPEKVWVKVLGMLQQNWAFVERRPEIFMIHFFDDHKEIFDQLEFKTNDLAVAGLIKNGFEPSSIHEGFIQTLNYDANFKIAYDIFYAKIAGRRSCFYGSWTSRARSCLTLKY